MRCAGLTHCNLNQRRHMICAWGGILQQKSAKFGVYLAVHTAHNNHMRFCVSASQSDMYAHLPVACHTAEDERATRLDSSLRSC